MLASFYLVLKIKHPRHFLLTNEERSLGHELDNGILGNVVHSATYLSEWSYYYSESWQAFFFCNWKLVKKS